LPKGLDLNSQYFCDIVLEEARLGVISVTKKIGIEEVTIHMVHNSGETSKRLEEFPVTRLPDPQYSPDISPCHRWFFRWSEDVVRG
jgi:hypothetical protein